MKTPPDYYAILGVEKTADADTIKKAFRKLAMEHHPDKNQGSKESEATFKKINEAYDVLSDETKRQQYDHGGMSGSRPSMDMNDFVSNMFGFNPWGAGQSRRRANLRNLRQRARCNNVDPDIHHVLQSTLKDVLCGFDKDITFERIVACPHCKGAGGHETNNPCHQCHGSGTQARMVNPAMMYEAECDVCFGTGHHIDVCTHCHGNFTVEKKTVTVHVPAGIKSQDTLKISGMGHAIFSNPYNDALVTGDIYLKVHYVTVQNGVAVKNGDLYTSVFVPIDLIVADARIEVDLLGVKKISVKLKHDKKAGHQYVVRGAGMDDQHAAKIKVFPEIPKKKLDVAVQQRLLAELRAIYGESEQIIHPATGSADDSESDG